MPTVNGIVGQWDAAEPESQARVDSSIYHRRPSLSRIGVTRVCAWAWRLA